MPFTGRKKVFCVLEYARSQSSKTVIEHAFLREFSKQSPTEMLIWTWHKKIKQAQGRTVSDASTRNVSVVHSNKEKSVSSLTWVMSKCGYVASLQFPQKVLHMSGLKMYICCTNFINYKEFFRELDMPDTFNSWFLVVALHVWMCMVRVVSMGKDGMQIRNSLVQDMWMDVSKRCKDLGVMSSGTRNDSLMELLYVFQALLVSFDEGLLGDDRVLAGVGWRMLLNMRTGVEASHLELIVAYVRRQIAHLESQDGEMILREGYVTFLPLQDDDKQVPLTLRTQKSMVDFKFGR